MLFRRHQFSGNMKLRTGPILKDMIHHRIGTSLGSLNVFFYLSTFATNYEHSYECDQERPPRIFKLCPMPQRTWNTPSCIKSCRERLTGDPPNLRPLKLVLIEGLCKKREDAQNGFNQPPNDGNHQPEEECGGQEKCRS